MSYTSLGVDSRTRRYEECPLETEEIRRAVQAVIESIAPDADVQRIRADQPLRQQIELDSIDWLNVVAELHDRLSIEIPESDIGRFDTLDSIVAYVASRQAEHPGGAQGGTGKARALSPSTSHLVNGTRVTVRPIRHEDMSLEGDFVRNLSEEARYERFMATVRELPRAKLEYLTDVDQVRHVALVATVDREGRQVIVGVVRYAIEAESSACEFAVAVDDAWQGTGLAGILMFALMDIARDRGLSTMEGLVLATNTRMLKFARQLGFRQLHEAGERDTVRVVRSL